MLRQYYHLTKPGIIYGNALTAVAGFLLGSKDHLPLILFLSMLIGLSLVIGSACVFNNIFDRDIDGKMARTNKRGMVTGEVSKTAALVYGAILFLIGVIILRHYTNEYALAAALVGFIVYVFFYTPLKRRTAHATLIGAIAGATPPVVGYAAVANRFDLGALVLFLILVFWQMPHFYAIAIRRLKDYQDAGVPVLPAKSGIKNTKIQILIYLIAFIFSAFALTIFGFTGYVYLAVMIVLSLIWLRFAIQGFYTSDDTAWAKKLFLFSLMVLTLWCVIIPIDMIFHH